MYIRASMAFFKGGGLARRLLAVARAGQVGMDGDVWYACTGLL